MTRTTVSTHAAGVTAALLLFLGIMHEELELRFFPIITNVRTQFISRDAETVRFSFDFDKVRAGGGVQNSWWVDAPGNVGRYFQTPVNCGGEPLAAGAQAIGTHGHRSLCMHVPQFLRDKPFIISGVIEYAGPPTSYLWWRIPTPIPRVEVPTM